MDRQDTGGWKLGGVVLGVCVGLAGCEAATHGYGAMDGLANLDEDTGESDGAGFDTQDDSGGAGDEDQGVGEEAGETDDQDASLPECAEPDFARPVSIELESKDPLPDPCADLSFSAEVAVSLVGVYGLIACDCDAPEPCDGEKFELSLGLPDPTWMPTLAVGSCQRFRVFTEEVSPGVCRHNRVDIAEGPADPPWYSVGSAREDLDHGGLSVVPRAIPLETCRGECGAWELREAQFTTPDGEALTLAWDESGLVGPYEVMHWRSFVGPESCGEGMTGRTRDVTAWTAR